MAYRGTDNLRCYIRESTLPQMLSDPAAPQMPPEGHKSHINHLKVRPEKWRKLQHIHRLLENPLERSIGIWIDRYIPEVSLGVEDEDPESGERLSVPCPPTFDIPSQRLRRPADLSRLSPWLDNLTFMTVQRILHLIFPATHGWGFRPGNNNDRDKDIFDYYLWTRNKAACGQEEANEIGYTSVLIAYQPPWVLSPQDMKEFASCRSMPPFRVEGHAFPTPLQSSERLWAKLWDTCASKNCRWFCVTTYDQWVFGVFTKGWTAAFVTAIYNFDDYGPTILEHLLYWVASAMRLPGSARIPQVPEAISSLGLPSIPPTNNTDLSTPVPSESNWEGKSEDAGSSAGLDNFLSPLISDAGLPQLPRPLETLNQSYKVETWMQNIEITIPGPEIPNNPALSYIPASGLMNQMPQLLGDWLF